MLYQIVLSGFIITYIHFSDLGDARTFPSFWIKRLLRIFPVYWIITALFGLRRERRRVPVSAAAGECQR